MVKVAIAGGAGDLGRHIVDTILEGGKHEVVVLSRSANPQLERRGVKVAVVSYDDPSSLEVALQGIHTVISTIATLDGSVLLSSQLALLAASKKAGVRRFVPGEFAVRGLPDDPIEFYRSKATLNDAVSHSGLEYTIFENGSFMNYLANGTPGMGYLGKTGFVIDTVKNTAVLPGDGSAYLIHTRVEDIAAFVVALLDLPKWPEISRAMGDRISWNNVVALLEKYKGTKFNVTYLSESELQQRIVPGAGPAVNFYVELMLQNLRTDRVSYEHANINETFPHIKPMKVDEFLKTWWGGEVKA